MDRLSLNHTQKSNMDQAMRTKTKSQNLQVFIRVRPQLRSEFGKDKAITCDPNGRTVNINTKTNIIQSTLDGAFNENSTQKEVFQKIEHYIPATIQGFNCTIFAYGQTGSGKTHTMFGSDWENVVVKAQGNLVNLQNTYIGDIDEDENFSGLIPRSIFSLFREIQTEENAPRKFAVYCSFLQIYNEKIYDLLTDKYAINSLNIRENKIDGIYVEGLSEYCVSNFQECLMLMQRGEKNRFIRHTSNNVKSSRSHTIFQLTIESTKADSTGKLQRAKFNLCDLAGSEKLKKSEELEGAHLKELKNINLSLTTLGKVIHNLSQDQRLPIPYRESKLTRLLQDSLGGNTRTCLIATVSPTLEYVDESLNTLKFAERAKHIVTEVKANKIEAVDAELVQKLQKEIKYLKEILNIRRKGTSAINQVHNKLLILQEENDRLRNAHVNVQEVERLMEENRQMRMELQHLKIDGQSDNSGFKTFDNTIGMTTYKQGLTTPMRGGLEKMDDILDTLQAEKDDYPRKISRPGSNGPTNSNKFFDATRITQDFKQGYFEGYNSPSNGQTSLMMTGKLLSSMVTPSNKSQAEPIIDPLSLPLRMRGVKKNGESKSELGKPPVIVQKAEQRKKEQERALRRLRDLEEWQRKMRGKEMQNDMSRMREEKNNTSRIKEERPGNNTSREKGSESKEQSDTVSVINSNLEKQYSNRYQFADFDKMYNPYKVRQEIEKKYQGQGGRTQSSGKTLPHNASKLKLIERNFFN